MTQSVFRSNFSLKSLNTFRIKAQARFFLVVHTLEEVRAFFMDKSAPAEPVLILGGGSNVLFTKDYEGTIVLNQLKGITILNESDKHVEVEVNSGEVWHDFVLWAIEQNLGGIENLSLIPGTVGAAPMQNIGAYGVEVKDTITQVKAVQRETGEIRLFSNTECDFGYRESIFKKELRDQFFISSVIFRLNKGSHELKTSYGAIQQQLDENGIIEPTIKDVSDAVISIRQSKLPDPKVIGNAGSFFKNPVISKDQFEEIKKNHPDVVSYPVSETEIKVPAGWLIDRAGWKGQTFGEIGVHKNQALVLVNYGEGQGKEIVGLARKIQADIKTKFGIDLTPEVNFI